MGRGRPRKNKDVIKVIERNPDECPYCHSLDQLVTVSGPTRFTAIGLIVRWRDCKSCKKRVREETRME